MKWFLFILLIFLDFLWPLPWLLWLWAALACYFYRKLMKWLEWVSLWKVLDMRWAVLGEPRAVLNIGMMWEVQKQNSALILIKAAGRMFLFPDREDLRVISCFFCGFCTFKLMKLSVTPVLWLIWGIFWFRMRLYQWKHLEQSQKS